jgi:type I restriction-modification system DNA methylase subunit
MPRRTTDAGDFRDTIIEIARTKSSAISVFSDFCKVVACALAMQSREEEYLAVAGGYERGELDLFAKAMGQLITEMNEDPFTDVLGPYYQEIASPATLEARGEFYTPESISSLMGQLVVNPEEVIAEGKPVSISEPCVGSGGMILTIAKHFAADKAVDLYSHITPLHLPPLTDQRL